MRVIARMAMLGVATAVAGCASAPKGPRLADATPPRLLGCSGYTEPARPWDYPNRFEIEVTVDERGQVLPGSSRRSASHFERGDEEQARRLAETCHFTPAEQGGQPVQGKAQVTVAF